MTNFTITGGHLLEPAGHLCSSGPDFDAGLTVSGAHIGARGEPAHGRGQGRGRGQDLGLVIDADGLIVAPGFVDIQINGGHGIDLLSSPERLWELGNALPQHGVTSFLPTIITSPPACTDTAMAALRRRPTNHIGAEPLGLHFEGPMLSPSRPGAHPPEHLRSADSALISTWSRGNGVALVTIAPELENATAVIAELVDRGVTVSAGHSAANADQARAGMAAGVTLVTHLFNAMSPLGHREPNLVGVALAAPELATGLIVDGVHLAPEVVSLAWQAKGANNTVLVTDAVAPMGLGPGTYQFGGRATEANDREVRTADGVLAGSILTLDQAVRNLVLFTGCEPAEALLAASATPARVIGESQRGRLTDGAVADIVLLDHNLKVAATICRGRVVYAAASARGRIPAELCPE